MIEQTKTDADDQPPLTIDGAYKKAVDLFNAASYPEADRICRAIIQAFPNHVDGINLLGLIAQKVNRHDLAVIQFEQAIKVRKDIAYLYYNLGGSLYQLGRVEEAVAALKTALKIEPQNNQFIEYLIYLHNNPAPLTTAINNPEAIENIFQRGLAYHQNEQEDKAIECYEKYLAVYPNNVAVLANLGLALRVTGRLEEAVIVTQKAIALNPNFAVAHHNLGVIFKEHCKIKEAVAVLEKAIAIKSDFSDAHDDLLLCSQYIPSQTLDNLYSIHKRWADALFSPADLNIFHHKNDISPKRKLKIGLLSGDLGRHPIGYFIAGFLRHHDPQKLEIICYSDRKDDDLSAQLKSCSDGWHTITNIGSDELARRINLDLIDILIDMSGHTAKNRMALFAKKPAPIQMTWAGYVSTTGLQTIDYLIADLSSVAYGEEKYYVEEIIRLPDSWLSYTPPDYKPAIVISKIKKAADRITLGNFGNPEKINNEMLHVWSQILQRAANCDLLLAFKGMDSQYNLKRVKSYFAKEGVDPDRITMEGFVPHPDLLAKYNHVDLALDTLPYSGGVTTMEALWMGVPVVTARGEIFAGRHATSFLNTLGLNELITDNFTQYIDLVVAIAQNPQKLQQLQQGLRQRLLDSPLCNHGRFADNLTKELRKVWYVWCEKNGDGKAIS
ncbi:MAG: tetratricopeptide repeat protein [Magnetococcales bacterium]|nr:tetratricopeptide repeat protein [Magnetococcales bacterium]